MVTGEPGGAGLSPRALSVPLQAGRCRDSGRSPFKGFLSGARTHTTRLSQPCCEASSFVSLKLRKSFTGWSRGCRWRGSWERAQEGRAERCRQPSLALELGPVVASNLLLN